MSKHTRSTRRIVLAALWVGMMIGAMGTSIAATILGSSTFPDVPRGSYYDAAIGEMAQLGFIKGFEDGHYGPDESVSRGQLAVILKRFRDDLNGISPDGQTTSRARSSARSSSDGQSSSSVSSAVSSAPSSYAYNPYGYLRFTTSAYTVNEAVGTLTIVVVRTGGNQGTVSADYALLPGTAVAGTDYEDSSGTFTLANKETSKKITITVKDDGQTKTGRNFRVELKNPKNNVGIAHPSSATITILDRNVSADSSSESGGSAASAASSAPNAAIFNFSANQYSAAENGGNITITVVRTGITTTAASVNYSTSNGTANSSNYGSANGTLSFAASETSKTFSIALLDNASIDGNKTVNIQLSNATAGSVIGNVPNALLTIIDTDAATFGSGSLKFSKSSYEAAESAGTVLITVSRTGGAKGTATVLFQAANGSAIGTDFGSVSATLTFAPGEASKIVEIPVYKDSLSEGEETVYLSLTNPTGADLISPSQATLYLYD